MLQTFLIASAEHQSRLVVDLLAMLAAAALVAMLLSRLRFAAIPAYIITGAVIGPYAARLVTDTANIQDISQLAILLLMFTVGLHLNSSGLRMEALRVAALGIGSTLAVSLLLWPMCLALGLSGPAALAASLALAMSSTAVVLRILQQRREMHSMHGRICVAVAISQDLISLVVLAVLPLLAAWAGSAATEGMIRQATSDPEMPKVVGRLVNAARGIGGIAVLLVLGRLLLPRLLKEAAKDVSSETLLVLSAAIALGAAVAAGALGFSPELGAFLAGFLLAGTDFRHQLAGQLSPMRDLFLAVFFTAVGLKLDLHMLGEKWWIVLLALPVLLAVKGGVIGVSTWLSGSTAPNAFFVGVLLCQAGEFSLVVLDASTSLRLMEPSQSGLLVAVVVLSLVVTPSVADGGRALKERLAGLPSAKWIIHRKLRAQNQALHRNAAPGHDAEGAAPPHPSAEVELKGSARRHVIIAGFGIVGRNLAEHFGAANIPFTVIELNPETVRRQRELGRSMIFGDIANLEVLESAGIHDAEAVVLTIPDDDATFRACRAIRSIAPKVHIAARTSFLSRAMEAQELGADQVTIEEVATAHDMAKQVMAKLTGKKG